MLVTALALSFSLSACVSDPPRLVPDAGSTPRSVSPDDASPRATAAPSATVAGIPIDLDCVELLPLAALYEYNPNIGTSPSIRLSPLTERVLGYDGLACGWSNQSSGERITAAVAHFTATDLEAIRDSAEAGPGAQALPEVDGLFWRDAEGGTLEAFAGEYWIVIESSAFVEAADALPLFKAITESLS